jgi:WD40 repeat protein
LYVFHVRDASANQFYDNRSLIFLPFLPPCQVYDESGQKLLHSYKHSRSSGGALTLKEQHLRGIAFDGKETLYVGQGSGELLVLSLTKSKLSLVRSIPEVHLESSPSSGGISALLYVQKDNVLVSGDDHGNIVFWSGSGPDVSGSKSTRLSGSGSPVNLLAHGQGHLAAAFASGHVRLYDVGKKVATVEIASHTRSINALTIHRTRPLLLSASEDTFVSVWQLPTAATGGQVKHLMAESPVLGLLTGCVFGGANQELIVTTTYDNRSLALLHTP